MRCETRTGTQGRWGWWAAGCARADVAYTPKNHIEFWNPVTTGMIWPTRRAFRIIQDRWRRGDWKLVGYLEFDDDERFQCWPREQLVICAAVSPETLRRAEVLLSAWMDLSTTPEAMQRLIDELEYR